MSFDGRGRPQAARVQAACQPGPPQPAYYSDFVTSRDPGRALNRGLPSVQ